MGRSIAMNVSIESFNISWNQLRRKGAVSMCNGLKSNYTVSVVDMSWNGLGYVYQNIYNSQNCNHG